MKIYKIRLLLVVCISVSYDWEIHRSFLKYSEELELIHLCYMRHWAAALLLQRGVQRVVMRALAWISEGKYSIWESREHFIFWKLIHVLYQKWSVWDGIFQYHCSSNSRPTAQAELAGSLARCHSTLIPFCVPGPYNTMFNNKYLKPWYVSTDVGRICAAGKTNP